MRKQRRRRAAPVALLALALAAVGFAGTAQAKLVGDFVKFQYCPWKTAEVKKCLWANTEGGEVKLGKKTVTIENDVLLQGGYGAPNKETKTSKFFGATESKPTLAPVAQKVPGGLLGIVPSAESPWLVKRLISFFTENSITGLNSKLELAGSPTLIELSELNMAGKVGVALKMPVKVRLENPFLGSKCYVGSDASPITWKLTSGTTSPPAPNTPITGSAGKTEAREEGLIAQLNGNKLVDNAWSAPKAAGCGGLLAFLVNPIVNTQLGTTTAGNNSAILENTVDLATVAAVKFIDESNP
jgi:hypothetical protein